MNRMYRVIFNCARGVFQVVSEHAKRCGKCKTTVCAGASVLMLAVWVPAQAQVATIDNGGHEVVDGLDPEGDDSGTQPNPWEISTLRVGNLSTGALTILNGGQVNNDFGHIGVEGGSSGTVTVRGNGSTWINSAGLVVGILGEGVLRIEEGGQVNSAIGYLGYTHGSSGTATITGVGSAWTNTSSLDVGLQSAGVLTVIDGGKVATSYVQLGAAGSAVLNIVGTQGARGVLETGVIGVGAGSGSINFDGGILRATGDKADFLSNFDAGDVLFDEGGAFIDSNGHDIGIGTSLQGAGGITKLGGGTLTLSGANSYIGATTVEEGTLRAGGPTAFVPEGAYVINGGTLDLNGWGLSMSSLSGAGGTLDMGDVYVQIAQSGDTVYDGDIASTTGRLTKSGSGVLTINGQISGVSNGLYVTGGTLALNSANSHGYTNLQNGAVLEVGHEQALGMGRLEIAGFGGTLRANTDVVLTNRIDFVSPGANHLTVDGDHNLILTGNFYVFDSDSVNTFSKTGTGLLTLSGDATFGGTTTVQGGALRVNGRLASVITVNDGATLGGSGTVGTTTVEAGGILAPGNSVGTLTVAGDLALSSGSILDFELGTPGTAADPTVGRSDRIDVSGNLQLAGTLNLAQSTDASTGAVALGYYRLMTYDGALSGSGLAVGTVPYGDASLYGISAGDHKVDLFVSASLGDDTLQHWQGGDGVWNGTDTRWLNQHGSAAVAWAGNHAIFKNQPGNFDGGTVMVEGTQRFKGLQFVDEGYRLQGSGTLETDPGGSEIRVLADSAEISSHITGTGGIIKTQAGTLVLSGANTYEGGTTISGGVLSVSSNANLGHEDGVLAFNGGVLRITGTDFNGTGRDIVWSPHGGGFDIADAANSFHLDRNIAGQGDLVKRGAGALWLAGANAYGNTRVEGGSVFGNVDSISGNIANAGTVTFNQETDGRFAGDITGWGGTDGAMIKNGAGVLALDGRSTLDWTVAQGGLSTAAARFSGDVLLDGTATALTFTDTSSAAYGGRLSGNGQLTLAGSGTLLLTGDSTAFAGTTTLAKGTLLVGNGEGSGVLGGSLDVLDGATLGGSGTAGSGPGSQIAIASGGTLAPGNSIGTLTVDGDLVFASGSRYAVEVDLQSNESDRIDATGKATLQGGSVVLIGVDGVYRQDARYRILSAGTGLQGAFDAVSSNFAFLTPALTYDYDNFAVNLTLQRNALSFESLAHTPNQIATARGLESLPPGNTLLQRIVTLPEDAPASAFDALSGEVHASVASALHMGSSTVRAVPLSHLRTNLAAGQMPGQAPPRSAALPLWAQVVGTWQRMDGDGNAAALKQSTSGLFVGGDHAIGGGWRLGAALGYTDSRVRVDDRASKADVDTYSATIYSGKAFEAGPGQLNMLVGGAYSWHDINTTRQAIVSNWNHTLEADYDAHTYQLFGELGYALPMGRSTIEPFVGLAWAKLNTPSFSESGGPTALSGQSQSDDMATGTLGLRVSTSLDLGKTRIRMHGAVGWRHAFGGVDPRRTLAFEGGQPFTVAGTPIARDNAILELGADIALSTKARIGVAYAGQLGGGNQEHAGKIDVRWRF